MKPWMLAVLSAVVAVKHDVRASGANERQGHGRH